jgi:DNA-binding transcriptional ArsR family regulator/uncharacterized protein YndB with AHSA1/START domain
LGLNDEADPVVATPESPSMDDVFKALADPSRRLLLDRLNARGGQNLRQLCGGLDMARQSVTKHLAILQAANLVVTIRRGRERLHFLNAAPIAELGDRWISRYDLGHVHALADLKHVLENTAMSTPAFVYKTYINTTAELLWRGLTDPVFTQHYWGIVLRTDWTAGSPIVWEHNGITLADPEQVVLEYDPYRRLAYTWHSFTPAWAANSNIAVDVLAKLVDEPRTRAAFDLEELDDKVKLTVTHDRFGANSTIASMVSEGWPMVLSALKTMLETKSVHEIEIEIA